MNMNLSRQFSLEVNGTPISFVATYNPMTHFFTITENESASYMLLFNPADRSWSTAEGPEPSIPVEELAKLVQQSFGVFV